MAMINSPKPLVLATCMALAVLSGCSKGNKVEVHKPSPLIARTAQTPPTSAQAGA